MEIKKRYLTSAEINFIVNACVQLYPDWTSIEFCKWGIVAQLVCEDEDISKLDNCNDIYDYLVENGIDLYQYVDNIKKLDELIEKSVSVDVQLNQVLTEIEKGIEELNLKDTLKELTETKTKKTRKKATEA